MSLKIMVVDSQPAELQLMRPLAAPLGHMVLTFDDSKEVGERAEKQRFDVVFVGMPREDGLELIKRIRSTERNREATIVMLSPSDNDIEGVRQAFGQGADFVLGKPLTAPRLRAMLAAMDSAGWKGKRHTARLPLFTEVLCMWNDKQVTLRSMNISESGILLQPAVDAEVGAQVTLEFKINEVRATMRVLARVVRKEGNERVGMAFVDLAPECINAIQLYVMGRMKEITPRRDLSDTGSRGMFIPKD
jgi:CheY-like chemotaxis protein